jgi:hypothetical protein
MPDRSPRFNGRVGLYQNNNIENYYTGLTWSSSWGIEPTLWYAANDKRLHIDYSSSTSYNLSQLPFALGSVTYSVTKNGLPVASFTQSNIEASTLNYGSTIGASSTRIIVFKPWVFQNVQRNIVDNTVFNPSTGVFNQSSIDIYKTDYIYGTSLYTNDSNSTQTLAVVGGTYSNNEWCIVVHKGIATPTLSSSGTINGRTMSATSSTFVGVLGGSGFTLGCRNNVTDGYIAEVLVYNGILSAGNTTLAENYLKSKWGISY